MKLSHTYQYHHHNHDHSSDTQLNYGCGCYAICEVQTTIFPRIAVITLSHNYYTTISKKKTWKVAFGKVHDHYISN